MSRYRPGIRVLVAKDCRDGETATGQVGVLEGRFWFGTNRRYRGPREHFCSVNPRIKLPDGSRIWGHECWWIPVSRVPEIDALATPPKTPTESTDTKLPQGDTREPPSGALTTGVTQGQKEGS